MATADELATHKINLHNDITVNGVTYKAGQGVEVPRKQAEDIQRIDYEHQEYKANLNVKRTFEENAGSFAVGS
jgi:hypothetical protein